jgi:SAM-dependent methyltransferase
MWLSKSFHLLDLPSALNLRTMDAYQTTFETWDKLAELYYEKFSAIRIYDETYNHFCSLLTKQHSTVLEIGCGPGNVTRYLLDHRPDLQITGSGHCPNHDRLRTQDGSGSGIRRIGYSQPGSNEWKIRRHIQWILCSLSIQRGPRKIYCR